jgi:UDP-glucose 4-epimerase
MAKCLVTGHKGYIGSRLINKLELAGHEVAGIDIRATGPQEGIDIRKHLFFNNKPWLKFEPDYIFHLAAKPSVAWSVENPSESLSHNVHGSSAVLDFARRVNVKRVIFASSAAVYGASSPYGLHKLMTEMECSLYAKLYGLDTVSLRYFNVYSEDQPFGGAYSTVIAAWMQMLKDKKPLRLDGDGKQTRDFVHLDDIIDANIFCMKYEGRFNGMSFDVGTGIETSLSDIKREVEKYHSPQWESAPARPGDISTSRANTQNLKILGWEAQTSLATGLQRCFGGKHD